jgi:DNA mismatch repair protein MutS2
MTPPVPDLLHPSPSLRLNRAALEQALTFAFAAGETGDGIARVLDGCEVAPSSFQPDCFADDLFLDDFVRRCMPLRGNRRVQLGAIRRLLVHPPRDRATVALRHACFEELLAEPTLRKRCEVAWDGMQGLRDQLEARALRGRLGAVHRRVEILRATKELLDQLARDFADCKSALGRLSEFAVAFQATDGYRHLSELLDYEDHLATVQVELRVGYDGQLRGLELVKVEENRGNPHYESPLRRFFTWLSMAIRGYRLRGSELLGRLLDAVFDQVRGTLVDLLQAGTDLEFYLAGLGFRDLATQKQLAVCLPTFDGESAGIEQLWNPFLLHEERPPVPCDVQVGGRAITVVTGPNSGGKTRLLQAVGLAQLLGQAGCFVAARRAHLGWRPGLFVSLVHGAGCDESEGRLGSELRRIRHLFEQAPLGCLVLLDELCSGTNPSEGEELFGLVVSLLAHLEPQAFISTHFLQFAERMQHERATDGLDFLQVELDEHFSATYRFIPGVAKSSLAQQTAERLGVTREALLGLIEEKRREES